MNLNLHTNISISSLFSGPKVQKTLKEQEIP